MWLYFNSLFHCMFQDIMVLFFSWLQTAVQIQFEWHSVTCAGSVLISSQKKVVCKVEVLSKWKKKVYFTKPFWNLLLWSGSNIYVVFVSVPFDLSSHLVTNTKQLHTSPLVGVKFFFRSFAVGNCDNNAVSIYKLSTAGTLSCRNCSHSLLITGETFSFS